MNKEYTNKLLKDFPTLFKRIRSFGVGDGWFGLVYKLSKQLSDELERLREEGVPAAKLPVALQVKEKFGGLRFYVANTNLYIRKCIQDAERVASKTCEDCGLVGSLDESRSWILTLCEKHQKELKC